MTLRLFTRAVTGTLAFIVAGSPALADEACVQKVEESLYNFRSIRTARMDVPSEFSEVCTSFGGFPVSLEDSYDVYSWRTRASDGLVVNTADAKIGSATVCFGQFVPVTASVPIHVVYDIRGLTFVADGSCEYMLPFDGNPVPGSNIVKCSARVAPSEDFDKGGFLVTSSAAGPSPVEPSDPNACGLHENSFTTLRLWKGLPQQ